MSKRMVQFSIYRYDPDKDDAPYMQDITVELEQFQVDALASFIYNVGVANFRNSTMLRLINAGDFDGAARQFPRWNKAGGKVLNGLTRRRNDEMMLFMGE